MGGSPPGETPLMVVYFARAGILTMMMVIITIIKIVVMIYFSCSQCCLPQFPGLLNFPYDTILSAGAFLVTDAFLHACSVISCFFAETTFLDFF